MTAEVQDETHQTIAANVAIPAHHAARLLRHRSRQPDRRGEWRPRRSRSSSVDQKGNRIAAGGTFRAVRHGWSCAWEALGYRGSYRCEQRDGEVMRQTIAVAAEGATNVKLRLPARANTS